MRNYLAIVTGIISALCAIATAEANDNHWNKETFEYYASVIRKSPAMHERLISACAEKQQESADGVVNSELEHSTGMTPPKAAQEICRRMIKGIASGAVTFEVYRQWVDTPDGRTAIFPDYK
jgi:hypothetical protein